MAGLRAWLTLTILTGLFAYVLILGGTALVGQNSDNSLESDSGLASYISSINETLNKNVVASSDVNKAFSNSSVTTTTSIPYVDAVGGVWKTMRQYPIMLYDLTLGFVFTKLLGDTQKIIIINTLLAIVTITVVFFAWKWIATGDAE